MIRRPPKSPLFPYTPLFRSRKNISFSVPESYRDVRLRMTSPPAGGPDVIIGCSNDNFAMRPNQFTSISFKDNDWVTANTDRKSTRLNSSHLVISYAVFCLKK